MIFLKRRRRIAIVIILILGFFVILQIRLQNALDDYGSTAIKNAVHERVNDVFVEYYEENTELFSKLVSREYAPDGSLSAIEMNTAAMGALKSGLTSGVLEVLDTVKSEGFKVPLGNLSGSKLLSGHGPYIKLKTVPLGTLSCDTVNEFVSVGINHTLHRVGLLYTIDFKAAYPFASTKFKLEFELALCESIIIGDVPQVYFN